VKPYCLELEANGKVRQRLQPLYALQRVQSLTFWPTGRRYTQTTLIALRSDAELYQWMDDIYEKSPLMGVSNPTNFVHQGGPVLLSNIDGG
jgi:protein-serine/threonine kinase